LYSKPNKTKKGLVTIAQESVARGNFIIYKDWHSNNVMIHL